MRRHYGGLSLIGAIMAMQLPGSIPFTRAEGRALPKHRAPVSAVRPNKPFSPFQQAVNRMTNWQRSQWARAGYPGLRDEDIKKLEFFVATRGRAA